jgi:tRNA1Val (adenine37-N6)-methyltransferase
MTAGGSTDDTLINGRVMLRQPRSGYRFSIDALLLAAQVPAGAEGTLVDLGTGCGVISLIVAYKMPSLRIWAVEIQSELADIAAQNVVHNQFEDQITVLHSDLRTLQRDDIGGPVDWVVSNPPFRKVNSGRLNPDPQRAISRHEIAVNIGDVVAAAKRLLKKGGRFIIIFLAERLTDLLSEMRHRGIEPKQVQMVHSFTGADAKLALVKGVKGAGPGAKILAPLYIYQANGKYTAEVERLMAPCDPVNGSGDQLRMLP